MALPSSRFRSRSGPGIRGDQGGPRKPTHDPFEGRRPEGGRPLRAGRGTPAASARRRGVRLSAVPRGAKPRRAPPSAGRNARRRRPRSGRPPRRSAAPRRGVGRGRRTGARTAGGATGRRTRRRMRERSRRHSGVASHPDPPAARPRAAGGSPRPLPCAPQGARSKGSGPGSNRIGRGSGTHARRQPTALIFREETGGSFRYRPGTPRAPTGRTPIARRVRPRRAVATVVAPTVSGRIAPRQLDPAAPGPDVVASLRPLRGGRPGPPWGIGARSQAPRAPPRGRSLGVSTPKSRWRGCRPTPWL